MDRVLRILAIIAILSLGLFTALARLLDAVQQPTMGYGLPSVTDLLLPALPSILVNLVGSTSSALCLAVGVVALVACIQRRQRRWAITLLTLLFIAAAGPVLVTEVAGVLAPAFNTEATDYMFAQAPYVGLLLTALVPFVVLGYTIYARRRATQPVLTIE